MEWATRSRKHEYEKELVKLMNDTKHLPDWAKNYETPEDALRRQPWFDPERDEKIMADARMWKTNNDGSKTFIGTLPDPEPTPTFRTALVQQLRTEKHRDPAAFLMFMILMAFIAISGPIALTLLVIEGYRQIGGVL